MKPINSGYEKRPVSAPAEGGRAFDEKSDSQSMPEPADFRNMDATGNGDAHAFVPAALPTDLAVEEPLPAKNENVYRLRTIDDILAAPVEREWILKHIIPRRGLGYIYGDSGAGKTFLVIDLICKLLSTPAGTKDLWFGFRTVHTPVTYLALEGEDGIRNRFDACMQEHGYTKTELADLTSYPDEEGRTFDIRIEDDLIGLANSMPRGSMVVVDTLSQACPGADQNGSADMGLVVHQAQRLAKMIDGFVLLVGHTGKDAERGLAGWQGQKNNADVLLSVVYENGVRAWKTDKTKDARNDIVRNFELDVVNLGIDSDGDPIQSCVVRPCDEVQCDNLGRKKPRPLSDNDQLALAAFDAVAQRIAEATGNLTALASDSVILYDEWKAEFYLRDTSGEEDVVKAKKRMNNNLCKSIKRLVADGVIYATLEPNMNERRFSRSPIRK